MSFDADVDSVLQQLEFHRRLARTHLAEDGRGIFDRESTRRLGPVASEQLLATILTTLDVGAHLQHVEFRFVLRSGVENRIEAGG